MCKAFVDLDGVIADFVGGALKLHGAENPYRKPGSPKGNATWDLVTKIGMSPAEFWAPMGYDFWRNLPKTAEADDIMGFLLTRFDRNGICFLTSPCNTNGCMDAKRDWVFEHYPGVPILFSQSSRGGYPPKWFLAGLDSILIDDHGDNIKLWTQSSGHGLLVPRPWNDRHAEEHRLIELVMEGVDLFIQGVYDMLEA